MTTQHTRPWFCSDEIVDEYRTTLSDGERLPMLKTLKIIRAIIVNLGIILLAVYSLRLGADPTIVGGLGIITLAGYNGLELSDYLAALRAYSELQAEASQSDDSESR